MCETILPASRFYYPGILGTESKGLVTDQHFLANLDVMRFNTCILIFSFLTACTHTRSLDSEITPGSYTVKGTKREMSLAFWKKPVKVSYFDSGETLSTEYLTDQFSPINYSFEMENYEWGNEYLIEVVDSIFINDGQTMDVPDFSHGIKLSRILKKTLVRKGTCFPFQMGKEFDSIDKNSHLRTIGFFTELFKPNKVKFLDSKLQRKLEQVLKGSSFAVRMCFLDIPDTAITVTAVGSE